MQLALQTNDKADYMDSVKKIFPPLEELINYDHLCQISI